MSVPKNEGKFISLFIVLISLFIFVFFTQSYYSDLMASMDNNDDKKKSYIEMQEELQLLNSKAKELKSLGSEGATGQKTEIGKYLQTFDEDKMIGLFYKFANDYSEHGRMKVLSLNMTEGTKNELGFNEATITVSARVSNEKVMKDFLNFLIENEDYRFFIKSFTVPKDTGEAFNIKVPLTIFYKDIPMVKTDSSDIKK